jgi:hypothetical protein
MESLINLVAAISSHAERVSLAIGNSSHREMEQHLLAFVGLVCLAFTAGILTGFGAVRGMPAFFFASAVYFYIGGILLALGVNFTCTLYRVHDESQLEKINYR